MAGNNGDFRARFARFMTGRYGVDDLARACSIAAIAAIVVSFVCMVAGAWLASDVASGVALALIVWCFFRMMSKKHDKRRREEERWEKASRAMRSRVKFFRDWRRFHKDYKVFRCPKCGEPLKVPKGKGKLKVTCPNCHESFIKRS